MTNVGDSMSSIQIKLKANEFLRKKENVNLNQNDLEILWEFTKQDKSLKLPADLSDEEVLSMMDQFDDETNTVKEGYAKFKAWLKDMINSSAKEPAPEAPVVKEPVVETPVVKEPEPETPAIKEPAVENPVVKEPIKEEPVINEDKNDKVEESLTPNVESKNDSPTKTVKQFMQLYPRSTQQLEVNGQSYTISNQSKTSNNFAYYVEDGVLVVEGSDLKITSNAENSADNIKVLGNYNVVDLKQGEDKIEAEGDKNSIYAGEGKDFIKVRGDFNTIDMGTGEDTVWIAGNYNQAHGGDNINQNAVDSDKFYAMGASNNLFGQDGVDAAYYNTTDAVEGEFEAGKGQELRIEEKITDGTDFENWVNREDEEDGPPYSTLPDALDGHEVRAYDDNTYTDKYEKIPVYYTEYRDIEYRELSVLTTQNKETGEGTVTKYNAEDGERKIVLNPDGSAIVTEGEYSATLAANEVVFYDGNNNPVNNTGSLESTLEKLATGKLFVGNEDGVIRFAKPEIIEPIPPVVIVPQPSPIESKTEENGIITTKYNADVIGTDVTVTEDTNNNTGKLVSRNGISVDFAANGDIVVHRPQTGLNSFKYEPDNVEFYNPKTNETVARPEKLSDLMHEIAVGNISFKSKSALPAEQEGHTIKQVDDKYYTDTYEKDGVTVTDYKDLKHRTLYAQMTVNNETGEASFTKKNYSITAEGDTTYTMDKEGNLTTKNAFVEVKMLKDEYKLQDKDGNIVNNLTTQEKIYKIMTGELTVVEKANIEQNRTCLVSTETDENGCVHKTYETRVNNFLLLSTTTFYDPSTGEAEIDNPYIKINADGSVIKSSHSLLDKSTDDENYWISKLNASEVSYVNTKTGEIISDVDDRQVLLEKLALGDIAIIPKAKDGHIITYDNFMYEDFYKQDGKTIIERKDTLSLGLSTNDILMVDNTTGECSLERCSDKAEQKKYIINAAGTVFFNGEELGNIKDLEFYNVTIHIPEDVYPYWGNPIRETYVDVQSLTNQEILYEIMRRNLYVRGVDDHISL